MTRNKEIINLFIFYFLHHLISSTIYHFNFTKSYDNGYSKHPLIPRHAFITLRNNFNAIDNVLSLHYTNHTSNPLLNKILTQASSLTQTKITVTHIEQIMEITDSLYEIYRLDEELVIKFSSTTQLSRREVFIKNINKWIETHQELNTIPPKKSSYTTEATFELCSSSLPSSPVSF